eukprot:403361762
MRKTLNNSCQQKTTCELPVEMDSLALKLPKQNLNKQRNSLRLSDKYITKTLLQESGHLEILTQYQITQEFELVKTSSLVNLYSNIAIVFLSPIGGLLIDLVGRKLITKISIKNTFNIMGGMMLVMGSALYFMIQDPQKISQSNPLRSQSTLSQSQRSIELTGNEQNHDEEEQVGESGHQSETNQQHQFENNHQNQQPLATRINQTIRQARVEFKSNKTLAFCFMHTFVVRMGIVLGQNAYILLILTKVKDQNEAFEMISFCQGLASGVNFLIQIPMIKLLDILSLRVSLVLSQILRAFALFLTLWSHNQDKSVLIANIVLISTCNSFSNVVRDTLFQKNQGSASRGVINSLMDVASNLGMLTFTLVLAFASFYLSLSGCLCIIGCFDLLIVGVSTKFMITKKTSDSNNSSLQNDSEDLNIPLQQQNIIDNEVMVQRNSYNFDEYRQPLNQINNRNTSSNQNMQINQQRSLAIANNNNNPIRPNV